MDLKPTVKKLRPPFDQSLAGDARADILVYCHWNDDLRFALQLSRPDGHVQIQLTPNLEPAIIQDLDLRITNEAADCLIKNCDGDLVLGKMIGEWLNRCASVRLTIEHAQLNVRVMFKRRKLTGSIPFSEVAQFFKRLDPLVSA